MIYPLIPVFIKSVLGLGAVALGIVEGIAESLNSLLKIFFGWLSDKFQRRKTFIILGYGISNLLRPLIGITGSWGVLLGLRAGDRIGKGIRTSPRDAMICELSSQDKRGYAFGFQRAMDHGGAVIGPLISSALLILVLLDIRIVFLYSYVPGIIVVLLVVFGISEVKRQKGENLAASSINFNSFRSNGNLKRDEPIPKFKDLKKLGEKFSYFLLILIIFSLGNSTDAFLILRASDLGIKTALIPMLWVVLHISKSVFSISGGYLSDKIGRKTMISLGWIVYFFAYLGFAFARQSWHIWVLFAFYGLFFGFTEGAEKALIGDLVKENRGLAYGFYHFAIGIAALPASIIFGLVWKLVSFKAAFIMGSCLALVAMLMLPFLKVPQSGHKGFKAIGV